MPQDDIDEDRRTNLASRAHGEAMILRSSVSSVTTLRVLRLELHIGLATSIREGLKGEVLVT